MFTQPFIQSQINENIKAGLCGNSPVTGEFPAQMARKAEMFPFDDVITDNIITRCYIRNILDKDLYNIKENNIWTLTS